MTALLSRQVTIIEQQRLGNGDHMKLSLGLPTLNGLFYSALPWQGESVNWQLQVSLTE